MLEAARAAGLPVVYLNMEPAPDLSDAGPRAGPHRVKHGPLALGDAIEAPDGSAGQEPHPRHLEHQPMWPRIAPEPGDIVVAKHRYSGFFETELDDVLRGLGATQLLIAGCTTSVCVESTVRDATFRDSTCIVLEDCTSRAARHARCVAQGDREAVRLGVERPGRDRGRSPAGPIPVERTPG